MQHDLYFSGGNRCYYQYFSNAIIKGVYVMRFIGKARWEAPFNEPRKVITTENFAFVDSTNFEWFVPEGTVIDGSSIPRFLWPVIGSPFVGLHRLASIPHDLFCVTKSRPHKDVHRMYYEACLTNGVNKAKASILYHGIKLGGPKWKPSMTH